MVWLSPIAESRESMFYDLRHNVISAIPPDTSLAL